MKNFIKLVLCTFIFFFSSCENTLVRDYNNAIVGAHDELNTFSADLTSKIKVYAGKPEKKDEFKDYIKKQREQLLVTRKKVENLALLEDAGLRKNCLNLFDSYETLLLTLNLKADLFTATPTFDNKIMEDVIEKLNKIGVAEQELIRSQYEFAEQNNAQLR